VPQEKSDAFVPLARATELRVSRTGDEMIIDHSCRLHERITDRRPDEFESASQQVAAHGVGFGAVRGYVSQSSPTILDWFAVDKPPKISIETSEFFSHLEKSLRVLDCSRDFQSVPHDAIVAEQSLDVSLAIAGNLFRAKSIERFSVVLALFQNSVPAQSRLRSFEDEEFEEHSIVVHRNAPFLIVISDRGFCGRPGTTRHDLAR
jgi:hypothetical protein